MQNEALLRIFDSLLFNGKIKSIEHEENEYVELFLSDEIDVHRAQRIASTISKKYSVRTIHKIKSKSIQVILND